MDDESSEPMAEYDVTGAAGRRELDAEKPEVECRDICHRLLHKITVLETDLTIDSYLTAFLE